MRVLFTDEKTVFSRADLSDTGITQMQDTRALTKSPFFQAELEGRQPNLGSGPTTGPSLCGSTDRRSS